jgi:nucleotide-binding universal stress UspA family protein
MKKILVPTDFSKQADYALNVATKLAKRYDSEIYLLHMLEMPVDLVDALHENSEMPQAIFFMKLAHQKFESVLARESLQGITVHETVQNNKTFEGIIESAHKHEADLIVMGSHGTNAFEDLFVGSNTEKVVRTADIPVLVIKNEHEHFEINDIVFPCDFSDEYNKTYEEAIRFANDVHAKIHLLYVNTPNNFNTSEHIETMMENFAQAHDFSNYTLNIYNDTNVEKGILSFARRSNADIIGMSTHGKKGLAHFFNGSISEDLVNHAQRPVITFKI